MIIDFNRAVAEQDMLIFKELLPKITDQQHYLGKALDKAVEKQNIAMFKEILPKITEQLYFYKALNVAIEKQNIEMLKEILPNINDQYFLFVALTKAVEKQNIEIFKEILPKITDLPCLDQALKDAKEQRNIDNTEFIKQIEQRVFSLRYPLLRSATEYISDRFTQANNILKQYDIFKFIAGADALPITASSDTTIPQLSSTAMYVTDASRQTTSNFTDNIRIAAPLGSQAYSQGSVSTSYELSAEQINYNLSVGMAALAITLKAFGQNIDWLKPALGAQRIQVVMEKPNIDLRENSEYNHLFIPKEGALNVPAQWQEITHKIVEAAKTGDVTEWSREQWENFIKDPKNLKLIIDIAAKDAARREESARPLTQQDLDLLYGKKGKKAKTKSRNKN